MKPRILFLDHTSALGGAELFLEDLAKSYGKQCGVLLLSDGPLRDRLEGGGVEVEVVKAPAAVLGVGRSGRGLAQLCAIPGVIRIALQVSRRARQFDLLFANTQKALVIGAIASYLCGKPLVWYLHDILTADHFSVLNRAVSVFLANRLAVRVIANSRASMESFVQCGGRAQLSSVVYNGIDGTVFSSPNHIHADDARAELGLTRAPVLAVFSRLAHWKGQHVLLDAIMQLPDVQVILIGAPLFTDDIPYMDALMDQVKVNGVANRVRFLGFREDVAKWMQMADVVVHTSVAPEPFGRVIVEGMLSAKPVVAARAGGACEIIEHGVTGWLYTPGDAGELADVLREVLRDSKNSRAVATAGAEFAQQKFSLAKMRAGIECELAGILALSGGTLCCRQ